jgi:hypothetical protein
MTIVRQALDEAGWTYEMLANGRSLCFHVAGAHVRQDFLIMIDEGHEFVLCYVTTTLRVPAEARQKGSECITRANFFIPIGNLDLDFDDGEVRYRIGIDIEGGTLTAEMVMRLISNASSAFDAWYPALMKVVFMSVSAEAAIREIDREA